MVKIISNYVSVHILFFNRLSDEIGEIQIMPTFHPAERTFVFTGSDPVSRQIMTRPKFENKKVCCPHCSRYFKKSIIFKHMKLH